MKIKTNLVGGIFFVIVAAIILLLIPSQVAMPPVKSAGVNPQFMPIVTTAIIGICGILLIFQSLILKKEDIIEIQIKEESTAVIVALIMLMFTVLIVKIGFLIGSFAMIVAMLYFYSVRKVWPYILCCALSAGIYFMFVNIFHIGLPGIGGI